MSSPEPDFASGACSSPLHFPAREEAAEDEVDHERDDEQEDDAGQAVSL
jgi:hypothetical protein